MKEVAVILHNIRSLHNVGSVFRTADAAGVSRIYLTGITPAPVDRFGNLRPQFAKVSLGAEKFVAWEKRRMAGPLIKKLKSDGCAIFAVEQNKKSVPYYRARPFDTTPVRGPERPLRASRRQGKNNSKVALIFGNEVNGLPPKILKLADKVLEVPMRGAMVRQAHHPRHAGRGKESLNVSTTFGIVVFGLLYPSCGKNFAALG